MLKRIKTSPTGPTFSRLVMGTMRLGAWGARMDANELEAFVRSCLEQGVTTFDHADIYGDYTTEADFGAVLKSHPHLRHEIELITKCGINLVTPNRPGHKIKSYSTDKAHIIRSAENSLKALGTDYVDLMLIHRPSPLMHPDEIAEAFTSLRSQGKVRHFGVSNFTTSQFNLLNSRIDLVTNQIEASVVHLDPFLDGSLDQCLQLGFHPMIWSPLGGGKLFQKKEIPQTARIRKVAGELQKKYDASGIDQILLAWILKHPTKPLPVLGTTKTARVTSAVKALSIELTDEEWFEIWEASDGGPVP